MVSLLQDQARIKLPSLAPLEGSPPGDRMQACAESGSPSRQERPAFHPQPPGGHGRPDRTPRGSGPVCGASPPRPEQLFARFPAGQRRPREAAAAFEAPPPAETTLRRRPGFEEGAPRGRFAKGAPRTPFHPYLRQGPEEPFPAAARDGFEGAAGAQDFGAPPPHLAPDPAWGGGLQYGSLGPPEPHLQRAVEADARLRTSPPEEQPGPYCCQPPGPPGYCASHPFHQFLTGSALPLPFLSAPHHPYQRMGVPGPQRQPPQPPPPLFPKPIYSYSILIFMALRNSKTGSLPVSEIYNFMTEHFPYFKTAPDGWKNSVRHNLSLNKCFEKVESRAGGSSRKGCLWALNPARVDKMQEELQKWKRKDPMAARKSMARPEDLETLIGDKSEKAPPCSPGGPGGPSLSGQMLLQPLPLYAQNGQGALPSPVPARSPPGCGMKTLAAPHPELLLLDGDLSMDVDALNPSLTGFDLQGSLWEALKDDSLAVEPLGLVLGPPADFPAPCPAEAGHGHDRPPQHHRNLPDVQLTTLYSALMDVETGLAPAYLHPSGSKPVALV